MLFLSRASTSQVCVFSVSCTSRPHASAFHPVIMCAQKSPHFSVHPLVTPKVNSGVTRSAYGFRLLTNVYNLPAALLRLSTPATGPHLVVAPPLLRTPHDESRMYRWHRRYAKCWVYATDKLAVPQIADVVRSTFKGVHYSGVGSL